MIIEVRKLNALKKYEGDFSFDYNAPETLVAVPLFNFVGAVKVEGSYVINEDDSVDISLRLKFRLAGSCSYCLEHTEKDIEYSYDALFDTKESDDAYVYNGINLDLTAAINDAILFSQPSIILCKDGCKGIDLK